MTKDKTAQREVLIMTLSVLFGILYFADMFFILPQYIVGMNLRQESYALQITAIIIAGLIFNLLVLATLPHRNNEQI